MGGDEGEATKQCTLDVLNTNQGLLLSNALKGEIAKTPKT